MKTWVIYNLYLNSARKFQDHGLHKMLRKNPEGNNQLAIQDLVFEPRSTKKSGVALADQKLSCKPKIKHHDHLGVQKNKTISNYLKDFTCWLVWGQP